jgi:N-acetylneuraminate lyase
MQYQKIQGLIAAPFTPMLPTGEINTRMIKPYAEKLKRDGLSGVFICGTTGEGMFLTSEERKEIAEFWSKEQTNEFKVIVHVGSTSGAKSKELAEHAQQIGAAGTGAMGPMFLKPARIKELVLFCKEVASGASDSPFYYYHIPSVSGINLSMTEFIKAAFAEIPNFAGIKFSDNNFVEMQKILNLEDGKWDILFGSDEILMAALSFGVKGAVGSTYNYAASLYLKLINEFQKGNIENARKYQLKSVEIVDVLSKYKGAIVAGKALMKAVGIDCGPCRLPLSNLSEEQYENLVNDMRDIGFFELIR